MGVNRWWQKWMDGHGDLIDDQFPGVPVVGIAGSRRVLIERHRGVQAYSEHCIQVSLCYGLLCVSGMNLKLQHMTKDQLVISGQIQNLRILEDEC